MNQHSFMPETIAMLADPDIPYLGDPTTVSNLLRSLGAEAMDIRSQDISEADQFDRLDEEIRKVAEIAIGQNDLYAPIPNWNTETGQGIAMNIARRWGFTGPVLDVVKAQLSLFVCDLIMAADEDAAGRDFQYHVDGSIELHTAVWLGTDTVLFPLEE